MLKIGLVNLMILLSYRLFLGGEVTATQNFTKSVVAGENFIVEVTIEKGDHEGFAKWEQNLPKGLTAEAIETQEANFSFKNGEVKLIWIAIPSEENFSISYKVTTDKTINGTFDLVGKFSYLEQNDRKTFDVKAKKLTIKSDKNEVSAIALQKKKTSNKGKKGQVEVSEEVTSSDDITINRKITYLGNAKYRVDLSIKKKDGLNSFGKVEEYLPPGFTASEINNEDGYFSFKRGVVKILWMTLPKKSNYTVSYQMTSETDELDIYTVHGVVSYLDDDVSKQKPMVGSDFANHYEDSGEMLVEDEDTAEDNVVENFEETKEGDFEETKEGDFEETKEETEADSFTQKTSKLNYRVQIASSKIKLDIAKFKKQKGINEEVQMYQHKDWFMYTIGSFETYKSTKSRRNELWDSNTIKDAFIVSFKGSKRISTQEALLISNERWSK